jgi:hypothetical protein
MIRDISIDLMIDENKSLREHGGHLLAIHFVLSFILNNKTEEYLEIVVNNIDNKDEKI